MSQSSRLDDLLDRLDYFVATLGPFDDYHAKSIAESQWIASLTVDQAIQLLDWALNPTPRSDWVRFDPREIEAMCDKAADYAGQVGRRLADDRILQKLLELLSSPTTQLSGLTGLISLGNQAAEPALLSLCNTVNRDVAFAVVEAIQQCGTKNAVESLRRMNSRWDDNQLNGYITEVIEQLQ